MGFDNQNESSRLYPDLKDQAYGSSDPRADSLSASTSPIKPGSGRKVGGLRFHAITALLIGLWWVFSLIYNIYTKLAMQSTPASITIGGLQSFLGLLWYLPLWIFGLRAVPHFNNRKDILTKLSPQGIFHALGHLGGTAGTGAGAVSFVQVVKACEPFTTAFFSIVVFQQFSHLLTYLSLIPVVGGVSVASLGELGFNWYAFSMAMLSNVGCSLRAVYVKKTMKDPHSVGTNLTSANLYALVTIYSAVINIVVGLIAEGPFAIYNRWNTGAKPQPSWKVALYILLSGSSYHIYNELAFHALHRVDQVTHAVANTVKRVFIFVVSLLVFRNPATLQGVVGSAVAIAGTLLYSLAKQKFG